MYQIEAILLKKKQFNFPKHNLIFKNTIQFHGSNIHFIFTENTIQLGKPQIHIKTHLKL